MTLKLNPPRVGSGNNLNKQDSFDLGHPDFLDDFLTEQRSLEFLTEGVTSLSDDVQTHLSGLKDQLSVSIVEADLDYLLVESSTAITDFTDLINKEGLYKVLRMYPNQYCVEEKYYKIRLIENGDHVLDLKIEINSEDVSYAILGFTNKMRLRNSNFESIYVGIDEQEGKHRYFYINIES